METSMWGQGRKEGEGQKGGEGGKISAFPFLRSLWDAIVRWMCGSEKQSQPWDFLNVNSFLDWAFGATWIRLRSSRSPESPLGGWFPKSGIFRFSVRLISGKTCPNCTWTSPTFRKIVRTLGAGLKSSIDLGSKPEPPKTHYRNFTPIPHINTCLFEIWPHSRKDLSKLWNWLFRSQGPIPVRMAPCLTAPFWKISPGIQTSLQGNFRGPCSSSSR